ncbi:MAG: hypothetical protein ACOC5A_04845, partial [Halanaerobiales bacterium]
MGNKRYLTFLILTLIIFVVFFSLRTVEPVSFIYGEIIRALESYTGSTIEVGGAQLWPLNRVVLEDVQITLEQGIFTASRIEVYYNLT